MVGQIRRSTVFFLDVVQTNHKKSKLHINDLCEGIILHMKLFLFHGVVMEKKIVHMI